MHFNSHSHLKGFHATLSASQGSWVNYDQTKMREVYLNKLNAKRGDELHEFAATCIRLRQKLPDSPKTLNMYVNDSIGWGLRPEQPLFHSIHAFGTADAIGLQEPLSIDELAILRINDLKTGEITTPKFRQLEIYSAYFCLEYGYSPFDVIHEHRMYYMDDIMFQKGDPDRIAHIMATAVAHSKAIDRIVEGVGL